MKCPVCGSDCVESAHELLETLGTVFAPCPDCHGRVLDKRAPLPNRFYETPCHCNKRFIDEVFAHIYVILEEEGILSGDEPLSRVGMPLIHPGFFMRQPPYLPPASLVLVSRIITPEAAARIKKEVPEIRGVVRGGDFTPGIASLDNGTEPRSYELLAGCDVRADVFATASGPLVLYKEQSRIHIEFPRDFNPKIDAVEKRLLLSVRWFVDAACGTGTLGLAAARAGIRNVVLNDAWGPAAFWAAFNIRVNQEFFAVDEVVMYREYDEIMKSPVGREPLLIAGTRGAQSISVYQGDLRELYRVLPAEPVLAVLDLFNKEDTVRSTQVMQAWKSHVTGEVFIP